ncbi:MAG TPA: hypothetical protein DCZ10_15910 [Pelotomaculum sp.]|nr:hypothetical protein [Pelotomaculum sp.]
MRYIGAQTPTEKPKPHLYLAVDNGKVTNYAVTSIDLDRDYGFLREQPQRLTWRQWPEIIAIAVVAGWIASTIVWKIAVWLTGGW